MTDLAVLYAIMLTENRLGAPAPMLDIWHTLEQDRWKCALVTLYMAQERLEARGLVTSSYVLGGSERGYRNKRIVHVTEAGIAAATEYEAGL